MNGTFGRRSVYTLPENDSSSLQAPVRKVLERDITTIEYGLAPEEM